VSTVLLGQGISHPSTFGGARERGRGRAEDERRAASAKRPAGGAATPAHRQFNLTLMSGDELERHLCDLFGRHGYTVWPVPSRGDVGAALLVCRGDQGIVVQVKRWNAPLGPEVVRALLLAIQQHAATLGRLGCAQIGGMIVTTVDFREETRQLAASSGVLLWNRQELDAQLAAHFARTGAG